jgi:hypothetical protein
MTLGDDLRPFTAIPGVAAASAASAGGGRKAAKGKESAPKGKKKSDDESEDLTHWEKDKRELSKWINPTYLEEKSIKAINKQFCKDSSVELKDFLVQQKATEILQAAHEVDVRDQLGEDRRPPSYEVGATDSWALVGPPHKRRHLLYNHGKSKKIIFLSFLINRWVRGSLDYCSERYAFIVVFQLIITTQPKLPDFSYLSL